MIRFACIIPYARYPLKPPAKNSKLLETAAENMRCSDERRKSAESGTRPKSFQIASLFEPLLDYVFDKISHIALFDFPRFAECRAR